jgi:phosphoglycolate phosphatase-like HAD superfamily hydrolase
MDNRTIVFDMDGTIADFYGVKGWLDYLKAEDTTPYEIAKPLYDMVALANLLMTLKADGWKVVVTTWLAKGGTKEYNDRTRKAKLEWLAKYNFPYDEIHLVKYGTTKANCTRKIGGFQVLVDDNEKVRKGWNLGATINANYNIVKEIEKLVNIA